MCFNFFTPPSLCNSVNVIIEAIYILPPFRIVDHPYMQNYLLTWPPKMGAETDTINMTDQLFVTTKTKRLTAIFPQNGDSLSSHVREGKVLFSEGEKQLSTVIKST